MAELKYITIKAEHTSERSEDRKIKVSYLGVNADEITVNVPLMETDISITCNTDTNAYNGENQTIASLENIGQGVTDYTLYYKKDGEASSIDDMDYTQHYEVVNNIYHTISAKDAGTYYIYYNYGIGNLETTDYKKPDRYNGLSFIKVGQVTIPKADSTAVVNNDEEAVLEPIIYSLKSRPVELKIQYPSDQIVINWPSTVNVETSRGNVTWICTEDGNVIVPGGTKATYIPYVISATVNIEESENYNGGTKTLQWKLTIRHNPPIEIYNNDIMSDDSDTNYTYPEYVRLDDDVSFQIMRTNPKLTTNTKLMYDGENMYMEAYPASSILSTTNYKHNKIYSTGLFNKDLRKFLLGTDKMAYVVGQDVDDTVILDNFDNQFENMYWCGVESINSDVYPQEMGCIAPLYLRKKRPNYFVIFKIDTPSNTNPLNDDNIYDFKSDILGKAKIVKSFDLREGTPIGNYIRRYVEQKNFEYDKSIYVNFSSNEIYYYGIDKGTGVLTQKVENFEKQLLNNDNTIMKMDDWITSGFERNNLIYPYIINFEFLFNDDEIEEYTFARYFGMYCNDIDLSEIDNVEMREIEIEGEPKSTSITFDWKDGGIGNMSENNFYYIKDKRNNLYSVEKWILDDVLKSKSKLNVDNFTGFELSSVSAHVERLPGYGHTIMMFEIVDNTVDTGGGATIKFISPDGDLIHFSTTVHYTAGQYEFVPNGTPKPLYRCSIKGTSTDVAKAFADAIHHYCSNPDFSDSPFYKSARAYNIDNVVIVEAISGGNYLNELDVNISVINEVKVNKITNNFEGGSNSEGCIFKIYKDDSDVFVSNENTWGHSRYLTCGINKTGSRIVSVTPYIHDGIIDDTYSVLTTDSYGPYVNVSNTDEVEIIDKFYSKIGILSFFPVRDFDFDTLSSAYGNDDMIQKELSSDNTEIKVIVDSDNPDEEKRTVVLNINHIPYGRFFYHNNNFIDTEYEYFFENVIPELCTVNKSVQYITKWGYVDDSKDSCENPYRLNTSKIFETCNFSANTFKKSGDILEYTHSMPYYINCLYDNYYSENNMKNEYQYIPVSEDMWERIKTGNNYDDIVNAWVTYFSNTETNNFEKMFGNVSESLVDVNIPESTLSYNINAGKTSFSNKRFNKKYSRFLFGNNVNRSSTLFRGVKFEIKELDEGKEVYTGKFNNYKFSFIYVPVYNIENDNHTVHFIKNDKYKFIVGLVLFDVKNDMEDRGFNKAYVYAGSMYYIK